MSGPDKNYVDSINYLDKGKKSFLDDFEKICARQTMQLFPDDNLAQDSLRLLKHALFDRL